MRRRDRERIAKRLEEDAAMLHEAVTAQMHAAAWYVRQNAPLKGFSFGHAALENARYGIERLKDTIDQLDRHAR